MRWQIRSDISFEATEIAQGKAIEAASDRYSRMKYRRAGRSGLQLPAISLGAFLTFGGYRDGAEARECLRLAFDLGITHLDFANNYGNPPGQAEIVCGEIIRRDLPRDELIISSKVGHRMWPGPYGELCSRKSIYASCDQSLQRLGVDYLDIFYIHRSDWETPFEEQMDALDSLIRQGKVLYGGVSSWAPPGTTRGSEAFAHMQAAVQASRLAPITVHQPEYSLLRRSFEADLFPQLDVAGTGAVVFRALAGGLLSDRYLEGNAPSGSRGAELWGEDGTAAQLADAGISRIRGLNSIAHERGQTLAQMAIAWVLRLPTVATVLVGASRPEQLQENVAALEHLDFTSEELAAIDALTLNARRGTND